SRVRRLSAGSRAHLCAARGRGGDRACRMKIDGQFAFAGIAPLAVWGFLTDANRIAQCLPGCESLMQTGEGTYDLKMKIGVGSISGVFGGSIRLHDLQPTSEFQMSVSGNGAPGFVKGEGVIQLAPEDT